MSRNPHVEGYQPYRDPYLDTVDRMEPDISHIDASAGWASVAISLKRIADSLEYLVNKAKEK
jgi:hypothetical protein